MQYSLLARLASEINGNVPKSCLRVFSLYFCRLITSDTAKKLFRKHLSKEAADACVRIKYELDDSVYLNRFWRAIRELSCYEKVHKKRLDETAGEHEILASDLNALLKSMRSKDRSLVCQLTPVIRPSYTDIEVTYCLNSLTKLIEKLVNQRLGYVARNDYSRDIEDMEAELRTHALRLIRRYEIEAKSYQHMIHLVGQGLGHYATNVALRANRGKRRILQRLVEQEAVKKAWWFNPEKMEIRIVLIPLKGKREITDGTLRCEVQLKAEGRVEMAEVDRLFETKKEALQARRRHRLGKRSTRKFLLDLSSDVKDDWAPTAVLMSAKVKNTSSSPGRTFTVGDTLPSKVKLEPSNVDFVEVLIRDGNDTVRRFVKCIFGEDEFFYDWCEDQGIDPYEMNDRQLGRTACKYIGVKIGVVKEALRKLPKDVWSENARKKLKITKNL
jgi:hypothetical protein